MNILIIEDHQVVAEGISTMLNGMDTIETVAHVLGGNPGIEFLRQHPETNLVLLDINLPDGNGIEFCATIKQQFPKVKIIALSTYTQASIINIMLDNGADSYLLKNASSDDLKTSMEKVLSGKK